MPELTRHVHTPPELCFEQQFEALPPSFWPFGTQQTNSTLVPEQQLRGSPASEAPLFRQRQTLLASLACEQHSIGPT
jgi:hypothetical protein